MTAAIAPMSNGAWVVKDVPAPATTHLGIQKKLDGKTDEWMEQVSSRQYQEGA